MIGIGLGWLVSAASLAAEDAPEAPPPVAGYDKGFFVRSPDARFELRTQAGIQGRFEVEAADVDEEGATEAAFYLPRMRLIFRGHAFAPTLTWQIQAGFDKGAVALKDAYVDGGIVPKRFHLRAGQFKRPFSRQFLTSGLKQEFVDRALTHAAFGAKRDLGLMAHNAAKDGFGYAVGVFNGTTADASELSGDVVVDPETGEGEIVEGKFSNIPDLLHPMVVTRVFLEQKGLDGLSEGDLDGGPLRIGVGASGLYDFDLDGDGVSGFEAELDGVMKVQGMSVSGAFYVAGAGSETGGPSLASWGAHVQAGYVIAERFEPAARYARVAPVGADDDTQEVALAFSWYLFGHGAKWQTDAALLPVQEPGGGRVDRRVRSQLQLAF